MSASIIEVMKIFLGLVVIVLLAVAFTVIGRATPKVASRNLDAGWTAETNGVCIWVNLTGVPHPAGGYTNIVLNQVGNHFVIRLSPAP